MTIRSSISVFPFVLSLSALWFFGQGFPGFPRMATKKSLNISSHSSPVKDYTVEEASEILKKYPVKSEQHVIAVAPSPSPAPLPPPPPQDSYMFWARAVVSSVVLIIASLMLFSRRLFSVEDHKIAYTLLGTVVGFWLK